MLTGRVPTGENARAYAPHVDATAASTRERARRGTRASFVATEGTYVLFELRILVCCANRRRRGVRPRRAERRCERAPVLCGAEYETRPALPSARHFLPAPSRALPRPSRRNKMASPRGEDYRSDLKAMMYGYGDDDEVREDTLDLLNNLVNEFITETTLAAADVADKQAGVLDPSAVSFALRDRPEMTERIRELLRLKDEIERSVAAHPEVASKTRRDA